ncbi:hypothetical protein BU17DRAFT_69194 [Hysterangium stoloniferum]|nr:hypothetical protein BU17DRAFT_69194 [Hysterangium stoloniferum]
MRHKRERNPLFITFNPSPTPSTFGIMASFTACTVKDLELRVPPPPADRLRTVSSVSPSVPFATVGAVTGMRYLHQPPSGDHPTDPNVSPPKPTKTQKPVKNQLTISCIRITGALYMIRHDGSLYHPSTLPEVAGQMRKEAFHGDEGGSWMPAISRLLFKQPTSLSNPTTSSSSTHAAAPHASANTITLRDHVPSPPLLHPQPCAAAQVSASAMTVNVLAGSASIHGFVFHRRYRPHDEPEG